MGGPGESSNVSLQPINWGSSKPQKGKLNPYTGLIPSDIQSLINSLSRNLSLKEKELIKQFVLDILSEKIQIDFQTDLVGILRIGNDYVKIDKEQPHLKAFDVFFNSTYADEKIEEGAYIYNGNFDKSVNKFVDAYISSFKAIISSGKLTFRQIEQLKKYAKVFAIPVKTVNIDLVKKIVSALRSNDKFDSAVKILAVKTKLEAQEKIRGYFQLIKDGKAKFGFKKIDAPRKIVKGSKEVKTSNGKTVVIDSGIYAKLDSAPLSLLGRLLVTKGLTQNAETKSLAKFLKAHGRYLDRDILLQVFSGAKSSKVASAVTARVATSSNEPVRIFYYTKTGKTDEISFVIKINGEEKPLVIAKDGKVLSSESHPQLQVLQNLLARAGFSGPNLFENIMAFNNIYTADVLGVKKADILGKASSRDINIAERNRFNAYLADSLGKDREQKIVQFAKDISAKLGNHPQRQLILKGAIVALKIALQKYQYSGLNEKVIDEVIGIIKDRVVNGSLDEVHIDPLFEILDKQSRKPLASIESLQAKVAFEKLTKDLSKGNVKPDDILNAFGIALYGSGNRKGEFPSTYVVNKEIEKAAASIKAKQEALKTLKQNAVPVKELKDLREIKINGRFIAALQKVATNNTQSVRKDIPLALAIKYSPIVHPGLLGKIKGADKLRDPFRLVVEYIELSNIKGLPKGFITRLDSFVNGGDALDFADTQILLNIMSNITHKTVDATILAKAVAKIIKSGKAKQLLLVWQNYLLGEKPVLVAMDRAGHFAAVSQKAVKSTQKINVPARIGEILVGGLDLEDVSKYAPLANLNKLMFFVSPQYLTPDQFLSFQKFGIIGRRLYASNIRGLKKIFSQRYLIDVTLDKKFYAALKGVGLILDGRLTAPIPLPGKEQVFDFPRVLEKEHIAVLEKVLAYMQGISTGLTGSLKDQILTAKQKNNLEEVIKHYKWKLKNAGSFKNREKLEATLRFLEKLDGDLVLLADSLDAKSSAKLDVFARQLEAGTYGSYIASLDESKIPAQLLGGFKVVKRLIYGLSKATYVQPEKTKGFLKGIAHGVVEGMKQTQAPQDLSLFARPADGILPFFKLMFFGGSKTEVARVRAFESKAGSLLGPNKPYNVNNFRVADNIKAKFDEISKKEKDPQKVKQLAEKTFKLKDISKLKAELEKYLADPSLDAKKHPENLGVRAIVLRLLTGLSQFQANISLNINNVAFEKLLSDIAEEVVSESEKKNKKPFDDRPGKIKATIESYKKLYLSAKANLEFEGYLKKRLGNNYENKKKRNEFLGKLPYYKFDGSDPELETVLRFVLSRKDYKDADKRDAALKGLVAAAKQIDKKRYSRLLRLYEFEKKFDKELEPLNESRNIYSAAYSKLHRYFSGNEMDQKLWTALKTKLNGAFQANFDIVQEVSGMQFVMDAVIEGKKVRIDNGKKLIDFIESALKANKGRWMDTSVAISDSENAIHAKQALNMVLSTLPMEKIKFNIQNGVATAVAGAFPYIPKIGRQISFVYLGLAHSVLGLFGGSEAGPSSWSEFTENINKSRGSYAWRQYASGFSNPQSDQKMNISLMLKSMASPKPFKALSSDNFVSQRRIGAQTVKDFKKILETRIALLRSKKELKKKYNDAMSKHKLKLDLLNNKTYKDVIAKLDVLIRYLEKSNSRIPLYDPLHADDLKVDNAEIKLAALYLSILAYNDLPVLMGDVLSGHYIPSEVEGVNAYDPKKFLESVAYFNKDRKNVSIALNGTSSRSLFLSQVRQGEFSKPLVDPKNVEGLGKSWNAGLEAPKMTLYNGFKAGAAEGFSFGVTMSFHIMAGLAGYVSGSVKTGGRWTAEKYYSLIGDKDKARLYALKRKLLWSRMGDDVLHEAGAFAGWENNPMTALYRPWHHLTAGNPGYALGYLAIGAPIAYHTLVRGLRVLKVIPQFLTGRTIAHVGLLDYGMASPPLAIAQNILSFVQDPKLGKRAIRKGEKLIRKAQMIAQKNPKKAQKLFEKGQKLIEKGQARQAGRISRGMNWFGRGFRLPFRMFGEKAATPLYNKAVRFGLKFRKTPKAPELPKRTTRPNIAKPLIRNPIAQGVFDFVTAIYRPQPIRRIIGLASKQGKVRTKARTMKEFRNLFAQSIREGLRASGQTDSALIENIVKMARKQYLYGFESYADIHTYLKVVEEAQKRAIREVLGKAAQEKGHNIVLKDGLLRIKLNTQGMQMIMMGKAPHNVFMGGLPDGEIEILIKEKQAKIGEAIQTAQNRVLADIQTHIKETAVKFLTSSEVSEIIGKQLSAAELNKVIFPDYVKHPAGLRIAVPKDFPMPTPENGIKGQWFDGGRKLGLFRELKNGQTENIALYELNKEGKLVEKFNRAKGTTLQGGIGLVLPSKAKVPTPAEVAEWSRIWSPETVQKLAEKYNLKLPKRLTPRTLKRLFKKVMRKSPHAIAEFFNSKQGRDLLKTAEGQKILKWIENAGERKMLAMGAGGVLAGIIGIAGADWVIKNIFSISPEKSPVLYTASILGFAHAFSLTGQGVMEGIVDGTLKSAIQAAAKPSALAGIRWSRIPLQLLREGGKMLGAFGPMLGVGKIYEGVLDSAGVGKDSVLRHGIVHLSAMLAIPTAAQTLYNVALVRAQKKFGEQFVKGIASRGLASVAGSLVSAIGWTSLGLSLSTDLLTTDYAKSVAKRSFDSWQQWVSTLRANGAGTYILSEINQRLFGSFAHFWNASTNSYAKPFVEKVIKEDEKMIRQTRQGIKSTFRSAILVAFRDQAIKYKGNTEAGYKLVLSKENKEKVLGVLTNPAYLSKQEEYLYNFVAKNIHKYKKGFRDKNLIKQITLRLMFSVKSMDALLNKFERRFVQDRFKMLYAMDMDKLQPFWNRENVSKLNDDIRSMFTSEGVLRTGMEDKFVDWAFKTDGGYALVAANDDTSKFRTLQRALLNQRKQMRIAYLANTQAQGKIVEIYPSDRKLQFVKASDNGYEINKNHWAFRRLERAMWKQAVAQLRTKDLKKYKTVLAQLRLQYSFAKGEKRKELAKILKNWGDNFLWTKSAKIRITVRKIAALKRSTKGKNVMDKFLLALTLGDFLKLSNRYI